MTCIHDLVTVDVWISTEHPSGRDGVMDFCIPEVRGQLDFDKHEGTKADFVSILISFSFPLTNIHISGDVVHITFLF